MTKKNIIHWLFLGIITIFTIILICVLTPLLLMGPLAEYRQYQFYRNTELDTEQSKKESLHTSYLNFDYSGYTWMQSWCSTMGLWTRKFNYW